MSYDYNKKLVGNSQKLRSNMTGEERRLWYTFLKYLPLTVYRQKVIENYILDFFIASKKLAIELDGSQHGKEEKYAKDKTRDKVLQYLGIKVLRYKNHDINTNFDSVCRDILKNLDITESEYVINKQNLSCTRERT